MYVCTYIHTDRQTYIHTYIPNARVQNVVYMKSRTTRTKRTKQLKRSTTMISRKEQNKVQVKRTYGDHIVGRAEFHVRSLFTEVFAVCHLVDLIQIAVAVAAGGSGDSVAEVEHCQRA